MTVHPHYDQLAALFAKRATLVDAQSMLQWDMATVMPAGGAETRANQLALLTTLAHEIVSAPEVGPLLDGAEGESLDDWQRANLVEMRRGWIHASAVPAALVEAYSRAASSCEMAWRKARAASDFKAVAPDLAQVVSLTREVAEAKSQALRVSPYDALLDEYEPGGRSVVIDALFDDLAAFLPGFLDKVLAHQAAVPPAPPGPFPVAQQKALGLKVMAALGFDFAHGRLDESEHPFCGGVPEDVRITTRYDEADYLKNLLSVVHETGHSLYERGLPAAWRGQPVGLARSMSVHEGQSLMMEMQVSRTDEFLGFLAPLIAEAFGADIADPAWSRRSLTARVREVKPDFIRVDADEVTYPAHVILRYRLEKALIGGDLAVADLPAAWNEGMLRLLGVTPPDDARGCLQDIHWYQGALGYFPTYTLGAMTAAQLFAAATKANPGIRPALARGDVAPLRSWLAENIHAKASSLPTPELLRRATGSPLDVRFFKTHLERRYLS